MIRLLLIALLLAQLPPFVRVYPPGQESDDGSVGVTPIPEPAGCPCFDVADIQAAVDYCVGTINPTCGTGDPYYALLSCDPGGAIPPGVVGIYVVYTATTKCSRGDVYGSLAVDPITPDEIQACKDAISDSGVCS